MNYIFDISFVQKFRMSFRFLFLARQRAYSFLSGCTVNLQRLWTQNSTFYSNKINYIIYDRRHYLCKVFSLPSATKLRQGNIFTSMCQEFCPRREGGVCLSGCWDTPPWADTPPSKHPPRQTPPGQTPLGRQPPLCTPPRQTSPLGRPPPQQTATVSDGTHPTGMHSCCLFFSAASFGENFYGLKRVMTDGSGKLSSSARRKSLIFLVSTDIFYLDFVGM